MRKFGYRVKPQPSRIQYFVNRYSNLFEAMEIKFDAEMLHTLCMEHFSILVECIDALSFHLPKQIFYDTLDFDIGRDFLQSDFKFRNNILVTHYYPDLQHDEEFVEEIRKALTNVNAVLCVENTETSNGLISYLEKMKNFAKENHFKVCIDIGHLLYSALKEKINFNEMVDFFSKDIWWKENTEELHIHDFDEYACHKNIGSGKLMDSQFEKLLKCYKVGCPIIIETKIQDLSIQGVQEVTILRERLERNADM